MKNKIEIGKDKFMKKDKKKGRDHLSKWWSRDKKKKRIGSKITNA